MTRRLPLAPIAALALAVAALPALAASESAVLGMMKAPVAADATLGSLIGSWRGAGRIRRGSDGVAEATQCRFTNTWTADKRLARLLLACRGTDLVFTADGYVGRDGGTYRGAWSTTTGENATISGRKSGSGLRLTVAPSGGSRPPGSLSLRVAGRSVTARLTVKDSDTGKTYTAFETTLRR